MKKKLSFIVLIVTVLLISTGCKTTVSTNLSDDFFDTYTVITSKKNTSLGVMYEMYDKETKVMYRLWCGGYKAAITPIYEADGSLRIYEGE